MKDLVLMLARALVTDEGAVTVIEAERGQERVLELAVAPDDLGRVIGKHGKTVRSIRTLLSVAAAREGRTATLEIRE